jgi:lycopene beta-cyclase
MGDAMSADIRCDLAIVGGGLAGGLVAYALSVKRPDLIVRLIEPGARFGGNHVWSFFSADIAPADRWIVAPFVDHAWDGYEVRFPKYRRTFDTGYSSIRSENFDRRLHELLPAPVPLDGTAVDLSPTRVALDTQASIAAKGVIDARGAADGSFLDVGWQKFLGQELRLSSPHGLTAPVIMDASVPQRDGFRFVYVLPFEADRVFVEDTYYSADADLDPDALRARIAEYAVSQGWQIAEVLSEEQGALPVAMGGDFEGYWASGGAAGKIGMRAGMFQAATGYSLPAAVRTAAHLCALPDLTGDALVRALHDLAQAEWKGQSYYRLLNRMAFRAAGPDERYRIYQRFYTLRAGLVERFYAGRSTAFDRFRILAGKPPVPIGRALKVLAEG